MTHRGILVPLTFSSLRGPLAVLAACFLSACSQQPAKPSPVPITPTQPAAATSAGGSAMEPSDHPGKLVYERACASCHNNPTATKSPSFETLRAMRYQTISYAMTQGKMAPMAAGLSSQERAAVTEYLVGREPQNDEWVADLMCAPDQRTVSLASPASVSGFGFDLRNTRRLTRSQTGLATADFEQLELAWAIGFPKATTMRSQPAIVGNMMYLPVADAQRLFAFDVSAKPCAKWVYENDAPLRTSAAFGELPDGRKVVVFSDVASNVHMVDALTGQRLWRQNVALFQHSLTTGTPVLHKDRVYVPISQYEITLGANNNHECCKTHGAVTALNALTGEKIWTARTMEDAKPVRDRGDGKMIWGPSGAPIWTSPAIDEKRGVLYVGTGEATSEPAAKTTDAILAIDLKDGSIRWSFQATENDIFLSGCGPMSKSLNCPRPEDTVFRDVDFGASVIIAQRSDGKDILLAGQKSGTVWALDPDNSGTLVWRQDFGVGSPLGGIHWGIASDGKRVFAPINRPYGFVPPKEQTQKPGIHAVDIDTGNVQWTFAAEPNCEGDRKARVKGCASNIGLSGAPTVVDGAVVEGSLDGLLRAFDATSGKVLFEYDTAQSFDTLNGVEAKGGSIDNASIVAANGMLFVTSGYGMFGQMPGNVLLAFKKKRS